MKGKSGKNTKLCIFLGDFVPCVYLAIELGHESTVTDLLAFGATLYGHAHFDKNNLLYKHMQFAIAEGQLESVRSLCLYGAIKELCKITLYPNLSTTIHCNFTLLCVIFRYALTSYKIYTD
jgi:hypothetical protein